jgi:hypothetical protein
VLNTGWGFGLTADIVNRKVKYVAIDNYFVFTFNLISRRRANRHGDDYIGQPDASPVSNKPKKALICESPKQGMTLTLQPPTAKVSPGFKGPVQLYR